MMGNRKKRHIRKFCILISFHIIQNIFVNMMFYTNKAASFKDVIETTTGFGLSLSLALSLFQNQIDRLTFL